jgi:hypothetical protein
MVALVRVTTRNPSATRTRVMCRYQASQRRDLVVVQADLVLGLLEAVLYLPSRMRL